MSDGLKGFDFFNSLVGNDREAKVSQDGKTIRVTGKIADGVNGTFVIRPSKSSGTAVDFSVDGGSLRHIEGKPKV
jgi:hypothetical protein